MGLKTSHEVTQEYLAESILWLNNMAARDRWDLNDEEVGILLGGVDAELYRNLKLNAVSGKEISITWDMSERISLLLAISKSLFILAPSEHLAFAWFYKPNTGEFLKNASIKNYLLANRSINDLHLMDNYLRSLIR